MAESVGEEVSGVRAELVADPAQEPSQDEQPPLIAEVLEEGGADSQARYMPISGYMDFHLNNDGLNPTTFDFHRFVLMFGHVFSDRVRFWSELELEHALVEGGEPSGELELEQAYLDFLVTPKFNFRAGMLLTPIGIINERHEPPSFHGVERPFNDDSDHPEHLVRLGCRVYRRPRQGVRVPDLCDEFA